MIVLVVLLSLFGFSLSSNTLVVYHGVNGSSIMATYYPYNFEATPTYVSGVASVYYSNFTLTINTTVPQLFAVLVSSGDFSAVVWSGLYLTPASVSVPAYVNGSGVAYLYFLNGSGFFVVKVPVLEGVTQTVPVSGYVYRVVSVGPVVYKKVGEVALQPPNRVGSYGLLNVNGSLVPALIGKGYAYLYGVNGSVIGLIVENISYPTSIVYVSVPSLPSTQRAAQFGDVVLSVLSNGSVLSNLPYKVLSRVSSGLLLDVNDTNYLVFSNNVYRLTEETPSVSSYSVPTPRGIYTVIATNVTTEGPVILKIPLLGVYVNSSSTPQGSVLYENYSNHYLTLLVYGPAHITVYSYQPPAGGGGSLLTGLTVVAIVLSIILVFLAVRAMRR